MKVILYSTPTCPRCGVLRKKMDAKGIDYEDNQNIDEMQDLGITTIPVLKIDDQILSFGDANAWINNQ